MKLTGNISRQNKQVSKKKYDIKTISSFLATNSTKKDF